MPSPLKKSLTRLLVTPIQHSKLFPCNKMSFRHIYIYTSVLNHGLMSCQTSTRGYQACGHASLTGLTRCLSGIAHSGLPQTWREAFQAPLTRAFPRLDALPFRHRSAGLIGGNLKWKIENLPPLPIQHSTFKIQHYLQFNIQYSTLPQVLHSTLPQVQHYLLTLPGKT